MFEWHLLTKYACLAVCVPGASTRFNCATLRRAVLHCAALCFAGWEPWVYTLAFLEVYPSGSQAARAALSPEHELAMRDPLSDPTTLDLEGCNRHVLNMPKGG